MDVEEAKTLLNKSRDKIDVLNEQIIDLIIERTSLAHDIAISKKALNKDLLDTAREDIIHDKIDNLLASRDVDKEKIIEILNNLGFETGEENGRIKAVSPTWRGDIEGEHDLVEEVVRMIGLDEIPAQSLPCDQFPKQVLSPEQRRVVTVKHELAARGMLETVTWQKYQMENLLEIRQKQH